MLFETVVSEGLAHISYLIGDEDAGVCAVIDPRRDVDVYLKIAHRAQVRIAYILETHIHADFVSGARELAANVDAPIYLSATGAYDFDYVPLHDGDTLDLGKLTLEVLHTPGHTTEHVCYLVRGGAGASEPWGVFTGDTLFAGEVGRPDLSSDESPETLARRLYHSLHDRLLPLGDDLVIYPAHGAGSPCGASIGDRAHSTIGYERRVNPVLQAQDEDTFAEQVLDALSPEPAYYARTKTINALGPEVLGHVPELPQLAPEDFRQQMWEPDSVVVDTREIVAFAGAHIAGALNVGLREMFPIWIGRMIPPEQRMLLVLPDAEKRDRVQRHLLRIGYENVVGYLRLGMRGWIEAGLPFERLKQLSVHELNERLEAGETLQLLDVRSEMEWDQGHVPGARHIYVPELRDQLDTIDPTQAVVTYCGTGYRASLAASLLERHGFRDVYNVPGSVSAWIDAGYPLEKET